MEPNNLFQGEPRAPAIEGLSFKRATFQEVMRDVLDAYNAQLPTIETFFANGREFPVNSTPAGVMALGQTLRLSAMGSYKKAVTRKSYDIRS